MPRRTVIKPEEIDSFYLLQRTEKKCAFRGCRNGAKVKLFWGSPSQKIDYICITHLCELANQIIGHYKR